MAAWIVLSQVFDAFHLGLGLVASVALAAVRMRRVPAPRFPILRFLAYISWLVGQIVVSNLRVARLSIAPRPRLAPRLLRVAPGALSRPALTLLGCSITLTPGTVTVDADGEILLVHALDAASARDIEQGILARRVRKVFGMQVD
jgi:multicomponent Na+:H+ antiporter subunit E